MRNQGILLRRKRTRTAGTFLAVGLLNVFSFSTVPCHAQPSEVSYQGELKKDGLPFTGTAGMKFAIIDGMGESLWSNDGTSMTGSEPTDFVSIDAENGIFAVRLGAAPMEPISGGLLKGVTEVALRVWVNTGDGFEQLTDQPISSSAFSLSGEKCLEIGDLQINVVPRWDGSALVPGALFDDGNNVGVGTNAPATKLDVTGTVRSSAGGFQFPDGTTQTTAVTGGGAGLPSGSMILTNSPVSPPGFQLVGLTSPPFSQSASIERATPPDIAFNSEYHVCELSGKIYLVYNNFDNGPKVLLHVYNPETDTWQGLGELPGFRANYAVATLEGYLYVIGGRNTSVFPAVFVDSIRYHAATATWSTIPQLQPPRYDLTAAAVGGKIYALGGNTGVVEVFDPLIGGWAISGPLSFPFSVTSQLSVAIVGNTIYFWPQNFDLVYYYDTQTQISGQLPSRFPTPTRRQAGALISDGFGLFAVGGEIEGYPMNLITEYDIGEELWFPDSLMKFPRSYHQAARVGDRVFLIGGFDGITSIVPVMEIELPTRTYVHRKS